ncbi:MAG: molybdopterin synthase catalytic subunit MoaE [Haliea sp.]|nr:molybdopterin synthase catalytic subunit MoaE [Haliea sp.]
MASPLLKVLVQREDFDIAALQRDLLQGDHQEGAVAGFTGYVRAANEQRRLHTMELEHYPGMTERSIEEILSQAAARWPVLAATVVHRIGELCPGDQIVWVGVASAHREAAFEACEFVMDYLKTRAPFWKRELGDDGGRWVDARDSDDQRAARWHEGDAD